MGRPQRRVIAAAASLLLVAAACGNAKGTANGPSNNEKVTAPTDGGAKNRTVHRPITGVPGVSDTTIGYDVIGTKQNNPLGICILDCYLQGIKAYFAYRNAQGGIYGRKLAVASVTDDALGNNEQATLAAISAKQGFGVFEAGLLQNGWGDLNNAGVPTYTWGISGPDAANRDAIFPSTVIGCPDCTRRVIPYAATLVHAHVAGVLGYSTSQNSQQCADSTAESFKRYAANTGVKLGYLKDDLPYGLSNGIGPEVTAMKKAHVDFVATCFDLNAMKTLKQEMKRQGLHAVAYQPDSYNQQIVKASGGLFDGDFIDVQFRPFEAANTPALSAFKTWMGNQHSQLSELAMVGWLNATLAYDGLLAAGPSFDRAKVLAATNAMHDFTADGLITAVDWSKAHTPYTQAKRGNIKDIECGTFVKVVHGTFTEVLDKSKPWLCWPNQNLSWSKPTPTNFK